MNVNAIPIGKNAPNEVNVIIENSQNDLPVKYELDKDSGALFVDRFVHTAMHYPANYGFVPHTLSEDDDPVDVLVVSPLPVMPGAVFPSRLVGVLVMEDDGGMDEKLIAVPTTKMFPAHKDIENYTDLPEITVQQIEHFFTHYKDLEKGKWVKIIHWDDAEMARKLLQEGIDRAQQAKAA